MLTELPPELFISLAAFLDWGALQAVMLSSKTLYTKTNNTRFWRSQILTRKSFLPRGLEQDPSWYQLDNTLHLKRFYVLYSLSLKEDASDDMFLLTGIALSSPMMLGVILIIGNSALLESYCQENRITLDESTLKDAAVFSPLRTIKYLIEEKHIACTEDILIQLLRRAKFDIFQYAVSLVALNKVKFDDWVSSDLWKSNVHIIRTVLTENNLLQLKWLDEAGYLKKYQQYRGLFPSQPFWQLLDLKKLDLLILGYLIDHDYIFFTEPLLEQAKLANRSDIIALLEKDYSHLPSAKKPTW